MRRKVTARILTAILAAAMIMAEIPAGIPAVYAKELNGDQIYQDEEPGETGDPLDEGTPETGDPSEGGAGEGSTDPADPSQGDPSGETGDPSGDNGEGSGDTEGEGSENTEGEGEDPSGEDDGESDENDTEKSDKAEAEPGTEGQEDITEYGDENADETIYVVMPKGEKEIKSVDMERFGEGRSFFVADFVTADVLPEILPKEIQVTLADGTQTEIPVTWNSEDPFNGDRSTLDQEGDPIEYYPVWDESVYDYQPLRKIYQEKVVEKVLAEAEQHMLEVGLDSEEEVAAGQSVNAKKAGSAKERSKAPHIVFVSDESEIPETELEISSVEGDPEQQEDDADKEEPQKAEIKVVYAEGSVWDEEICAEALEEEILPILTLTGETENYGWRDIEDGKDHSAPIVESEEYSTQAVYPSSYDLRSSLPAVRNQNPYGTCWTFGTNAAIESNLIKRGYETTSSADQSEYQLAYFIYAHDNHNQTDPLGGTKGDTTFYRVDSDPYGYLNMGGNTYFSMQGLANWVGSVPESAAPYSDAKRDRQYGSLSTELRFNRDNYNVKDYYYVNPREDRAGVKKLLMEQGAVTLSYWEDDVFHDYDNKSFYMPIRYGTNHAVSIVGWDDNFSRWNFDNPYSNYCGYPPENGAWLIRNSWGGYRL